MAESGGRGKFAEHCRRQRFLVLAEEEVAAGDRKTDSKLAISKLSPDDGEGDINIIPYSKTTFPNNPNLLMIKIF